MLNEFLWRAFAFVLAYVPGVQQLLIAIAKRTPDDHLKGYMLRFWLGATRPKTSDGKGVTAIECSDGLPPTPLHIGSASKRIHHILRHDTDRHMHDHPWEFRSIILCGWYIEERLCDDGQVRVFRRSRGDTYVCPQGSYHRIIEISEEPLITLCILGRKKSGWGFNIEGEHVDSHDYLDYDEPIRPLYPSQMKQV